MKKLLWLLRSGAAIVFSIITVIGMVIAGIGGLLAIGGQLGRDIVMGENSGEQRT